MIVKFKGEDRRVEGLTLYKQRGSRTFYAVNKNEVVNHGGRPCHFAMTTLLQNDDRAGSLVFGYIPVTWLIVHCTRSKFSELSERWKRRLVQSLIDPETGDLVKLEPVG